MRLLVIWRNTIVQALPALLAVSMILGGCGIIEDGPQTEGDGIHITLTMKSPSSQDAADDGSLGTGYESWIRSDDYDVLVYTKDGKYVDRLRDAEISPTDPAPDGRYTVTGLLTAFSKDKPDPNEYRIVVIANSRKGACRLDKPFPYGELDKMTERELYRRLDFTMPYVYGKPENNVPASVNYFNRVLNWTDDPDAVGIIPMWGVTTSTIYDNKSISVNMIRSLAKIELILSLKDISEDDMEMIPFPLFAVFNRAMKKGTVAPLGAENLPEVKIKGEAWDDSQWTGVRQAGNNEETPTISDSDIMELDSDKAPYMLATQSLGIFGPYIGYFPEEGENHNLELGILFVSADQLGGDMVTRFLSFKPMPVKRNHWYTIRITKITTSFIAYEIEDSKERRSEIEYW